MRPSYRYFLSITSQFPFCSIPFRLDSYSQCQFACGYCFAAARGGFKGERRIAAADAMALDRRLRRLERESPESAIDEMLASRVPLHFGGMSDPFMPLERSEGTTLALLKVLRAHEYPTIISTKSDLCCDPEYLEVLTSGNFAVQFSISTSDRKLSLAVDAGAPIPAARFRAMELLSSRGIKTSCRIQPLLPGRENDGHRVIDLAAQAGAHHVGAEHLKLSVEQSARGTARLNNALSRDLIDFYRKAEAKRFGREWVIPPAQRIDRILSLRENAWRRGLSFGAADTDLLHLSDGQSCCSGADLLGFVTTYKFTYTQAIHASQDGTVRFANIAKEWRPQKSIAQFVNSRSRLPASGVEDYVRAAWNGQMHGYSPTVFYGIVETGAADSDGFSIYRISDEVKSLLAAQRRPPRVTSSL